MQNALNYDSLAAEAFKPANFCKLFTQVAVKALRLMVTVHNESGSRKFSANPAKTLQFRPLQTLIGPHRE